MEKYRYLKTMSRKRSLNVFTCGQMSRVGKQLSVCVRAHISVRGSPRWQPLSGRSMKMTQIEMLLSPVGFHHVPVLSLFANCPDYWANEEHLWSCRTKEDLDERG